MIMEKRVGFIGVGLLYELRKLSRHRGDHFRPERSSGDGFARGSVSLSIV